MVKYSYEFKKEIVEAYLKVEGGCKYLLDKYTVKSKRDARKWVNIYYELDDKDRIVTEKLYLDSFFSYV